RRRGVLLDLHLAAALARDQLAEALDAEAHRVIGVVEVAEADRPLLDALAEGGKREAHRQAREAREGNGTATRLEQSCSIQTLTVPDAVMSRTAFHYGIRLRRQGLPTARVRASLQ